MRIKAIILTRLAERMLDFIAQVYKKMGALVRNRDPTGAEYAVLRVRLALF
jgi:hypothetical protein